MECIFVTGGQMQWSRLWIWLPSFRGSQGLSYSRAELGARQITGSGLQFSKNSSALGEEKPYLKGKDIRCLFDYSFHCLDALISCREVISCLIFCMIPGACALGNISSCFSTYHFCPFELYYFSHTHTVAACTVNSGKGSNLASGVITNIFPRK